MRLGTPRSPGPALLLILLTCGIYTIYWDYKMGKRIAERCVRACLPPTGNAALYLVPDLIGAGGFARLGLLNPVLQQESLNRVWKAAENGSGRF